MGGRAGQGGGGGVAVRQAVRAMLGRQSQGGQHSHRRLSEERSNVSVG